MLEDLTFPVGLAPPTNVDSQTQGMVQKIIAWGDVVKHLRNLLLFGAVGILIRSNDFAHCHFCGSFNINVSLTPWFSEVEGNFFDTLVVIAPPVSETGRKYVKTARRWRFDPLIFFEVPSIFLNWSRVTSLNLHLWAVPMWANHRLSISW